MKRSFWRRSGRLWIEGLLLFLLRLWQNHSGFDAETGLAVPGAAGTLLVIGLVLTAAVEVAQSLRRPVAKRAYAAQFAPASRGLLAAVCGSMLLVAGGAILAIQSLLARSIVAAAAGVLGAAAGAGFLFQLWQAKGEDPISVMPVLPSMFFGVFYVLAVYIPTESDPVLARTFLPVLAAAMATYAFSRLGGLLRKEASLGAFVRMADLAAPMCLAAAADGGLGRRLLYLGCAVVLTAYLPALLLLRRGNVPGTESSKTGRAKADNAEVGNAEADSAGTDSVKSDNAKADNIETDSAKADSAATDRAKPDTAEADNVNAEAAESDGAEAANAPGEATRTLDPVDLAATRRVPDRKPERKKENRSNQKRRK